MNIAIYARKSKLTEKGESIQNQINACQAYCNMQYPDADITIFEDEGFSGGNTDRPQFTLLEEQIKHRRFDVLISYKLDRISRSINDFSSFIDMLDSHNCSYVSIKEQFDTSTPMGRAMMYILAVFAQLERETISERIIDNFTGLANTGRFLGSKAPEGYDKEKVEYVDKNGVTKNYNILKINEDESQKIKFIFEKYLEWQSISKLRSYCIQNRILTRNKNNYSCVAIRRILTHPIYMSADKLAYEYLTDKGVNITTPKETFTGEYAINVLRRTKLDNNATYYTNYSDWVVSVGKHIPLISSENWIKVQEILEARKSKSIRRPFGKKGLLSGLLVCKNCGKYMRPSSISGDRFYYVCELKEDSKKALCNSKNARGDKLDKLVIDTIKKMLDDKDSQISNFSSTKNQTTILDFNLQKQLVEIDKQIKNNNDTIKSLMLKLAKTDNEILLKYITAEVESIDKKQKTLQLQKINVLDKINSCDIKYNRLNIAINSAEKLKNNSFEYDTPEKLLELRNILKDLIDKIEFDSGNIEIFMKSF